MSQDPIRLLGIAGSLRDASTNRGLLRALGPVLPDGATLTLFDRMREIPLYDGDVEAKGVPEPVAALRDAIAGADGLVFATPEYNYSVPGVLKNAIDWASRPPSTSPLRGKPAGILGASGGPSGTMRAQYHLRQVFVSTHTIVMLQPEMFVMRSGDKFDPSGNLTDDETRERLKKWSAALVDWVRLLKRPA